MDIKTVKIENPDQLNLILGQSHFIKTIEDLHEMVVTTVPGARFGLAFCEASDACLIGTGTRPGTGGCRAEERLGLAAGHTSSSSCGPYPINVLNAIKNLPEVCWSSAPPPIRWRLSSPRPSRAAGSWAIDGSSRKVSKPTKVRPRA